MDDSTVLVTGASGYIATHIVRQLLISGYRVRGTVRSLQNESKISPLRELCPNSRHPLELVEADLTDPSSWVPAVRGCRFVIHTASPFPPHNPAREDDVIQPALDGTLSVLRACQDVGNVLRVVLTSSAAAVSSGDSKDQDATFTEDDWSDPERTNYVYFRSKILAERAAWEFVESLPQGQRFELTVINPSYVIGPVLCGGRVTSMAIVRLLLSGRMSAVPSINFSVIDVRDVAHAHVAAMTSPKAAGRRYLVAGPNVWIKDMARVLRGEFQKMGYKVPTWEAPYFLMRIAAWYDKRLQLMMPAWGKVIRFDNSRMVEELGVTPRPPEDSLLALAHSLIDKGIVRKTDKYQKPAASL